MVGARWVAARRIRLDHATSALFNPCSRKTSEGCASHTPHTLRSDADARSAALDGRLRRERVGEHVEASERLVLGERQRARAAVSSSLLPCRSSVLSVAVVLRTFAMLAPPSPSTSLIERSSVQSTDDDARMLAHIGASQIERFSSAFRDVAVVE